MYQSVPCPEFHIKQIDNNELKRDKTQELEKETSGSLKPESSYKANSRNIQKRVVKKQDSTNTDEETIRREKVLKNKSKDNLGSYVSNYVSKNDINEKAKQIMDSQQSNNSKGTLGNVKSIKINVEEELKGFRRKIDGNMGSGSKSKLKGDKGRLFSDYPKDPKVEPPPKKKTSIKKKL